MSVQPFFSHEGEVTPTGYNTITLGIHGLGDFACLYRHTVDNSIQLDLYSDTLPAPLKIKDQNRKNVTNSALSQMIVYGLKILNYDSDFGEELHIHKMFAQEDDLKRFTRAAKEAATFIEEESLDQPFLFDVDDYEPSFGDISPE